MICHFILEIGMEISYKDIQDNSIEFNLTTPVVKQQSYREGRRGGWSRGLDGESFGMYRAVMTGNEVAKESGICYSGVSLSFSYG